MAFFNGDKWVGLVAGLVPSGPLFPLSTGSFLFLKHNDVINIRNESEDKFHIYLATDSVFLVASLATDFVVEVGVFAAVLLPLPTFRAGAVFSLPVEAVAATAAAPAVAAAATATAAAAAAAAASVPADSDSTLAALSETGLVVSPVSASSVASSLFLTCERQIMNDQCPCLILSTGIPLTGVITASGTGSATSTVDEMTHDWVSTASYKGQNTRLYIT